MGTCSVRFEGEEGWIETGDAAKISVFPESLRAKSKYFRMVGTAPDNHIRDFLNCVKSRGVPRSNAAVVAQSHIACHAAYISWQLGRKLAFDPAHDAFVSDEEANRMCSRAIRAPWRI